MSKYIWKGFVSIALVAIVLWMAWVLPIDGPSWKAFAFNMIIVVPMILVGLEKIWGKSSNG